MPQRFAAPRGTRRGEARCQEGQEERDLSGPGQLGPEEGDNDRKEHLLPTHETEVENDRATERRTYYQCTPELPDDCARGGDLLDPGRGDECSRDRQGDTEEEDDSDIGQEDHTECRPRDWPLRPCLREECQRHRR